MRPHELRIHGTVDMYRRGDCRCEPCTAAFMRSVPHGTLSGARHHGCTCDRCVTARRHDGRMHAWAGRVHTDDPPEPTISTRSTWSEDELRAALRAYHDIHGTFPDRKSREGLRSGTWGAAQKWLRGRGLTFRGLLGLPALRRHASATFAWSTEVIYAAACQFCSERRRWPTSKDGPVPALGGRTWGRANGWLRERGLTLASLAGAMNTDGTVIGSPRTESS